MMSAFLPKQSAWIVERESKYGHDFYLLNIEFGEEGIYRRVARFDDYDEALEVRNRLNAWEAKP